MYHFNLSNMKFFKRITIAIVLIFLGIIVFYSFADVFYTLYPNLITEWVFYNADQIILGLVILGALVSTMVLLWKMPRAQLKPFKEKISIKDYLELENELRKTIAQILGGAFLLLGLFLTWKNIETAKEGQFTDRFIRAMEQLGSEKLEIRLGAIFALERIARDSKKDDDAIMEILTHYIRTYSPWPPKDFKHVKLEFPALDTSKSYLEKELPDDIKAILSIIRRRRTYSMDLSNTDLHDAELYGTVLYNVNFSGANLSGANFVSSELKYTNFSNAALTNAYFDKADAEGTYFINANLTKASFMLTNLKSAIFAKEIYSAPDSKPNQKYEQKAIVKGANLLIAEGLIREQVEQMIVDEQTMIPFDLIKK